MHLHSVLMLGPAEDLAAVREDEGWQLPDHLALYDVRREADDPSAGRLHVRWADDFKRPGPDVAAIAARHPRVFFTYEVMDEFGDWGTREFYGRGGLHSSERVDPRTFGWAEWETEDDTEPAVAGEYGFADLVAAWRTRRRWARAHPDLADHHEARYRAFVHAFGVDLDQAPKVELEPPAWLAEAMESTGSQIALEAAKRNWPHSLQLLAETADRVATRLATPFNGFLEAPLAVGAAYARYGAGIAGPVREAEQATNRMILELFAAIHPAAVDTRVTDDDLRAHGGFDPDAPTPDPDDYW